MPETPQVEQVNESPENFSENHRVPSTPMIELIERLREYRHIFPKANVAKKIELAERISLDTLELVSLMAERLVRLELKIAQGGR